VTLHALEQVLAGESQLDEIVDALVAAERAEQLGES
jgi:protein subunit release factor A